MGHKPNLEAKTREGKEKSNRKTGFWYSILSKKCIVPFLLKERQEKVQNVHTTQYSRKISMCLTTCDYV